MLGAGSENGEQEPASSYPAGRGPGTRHGRTLTSQRLPSAVPADSSSALDWDSNAHTDADTDTNDAAVLASIPAGRRPRSETTDTAGRPKRRKTRAGTGPSRYCRRHGLHGQLKPGFLDMEIANLGQIEHVAHSHRRLQPGGIISGATDSVFFIRDFACSILLQHAGEAPFMVHEVVIRTPERQSDYPVQEGLVFCGMDPDELLDSAERYTIRVNKHIEHGVVSSHLRAREVDKEYQSWNQTSALVGALIGKEPIPIDTTPSWHEREAEENKNTYLRGWGRSEPAHGPRDALGHESQDEPDRQSSTRPGAAVQAALETSADRSNIITRVAEATLARVGSTRYDRVQRELEDWTTSFRTRTTHLDDDFNPPSPPSQPGRRSRESREQRRRRWRQQQLDDSASPEWEAFYMSDPSHRTLRARLEARETGSIDRSWYSMRFFDGRRRPSFSDSDSSQESADDFCALPRLMPPSHPVRVQTHCDEAGSDTDECADTDDPDQPWNGRAFEGTEEPDEGDCHLDETYELEEAELDTDDDDDGDDASSPRPWKRPLQTAISQHDRMLLRAGLVDRLGPAKKVWLPSRLLIRPPDGSASDGFTPEVLSHLGRPIDVPRVRPSFAAGPAAGRGTANLAQLMSTEEGGPPPVEEDYKVTQPSVAPHAFFFIPRRKNRAVIRFTPPVAAKYVVVKLFSPSTRGIMTVSRVSVRGRVGPQFFPSTEIR